VAYVTGGDNFVGQTWVSKFQHFLNLAHNGVVFF
jgi:hypothetical protein